jgi:hypothetical protein
MISSAREEFFEALEGYRAACSRFDYVEPDLVDAAALEVTAAWLRLRAAIRKAKEEDGHDSGRT